MDSSSVAVLLGEAGQGGGFKCFFAAMDMALLLIRFAIFLADNILFKPKKKKIEYKHTKKGA